MGIMRCHVGVDRGRGWCLDREVTICGWELV